MLVSLVWKEPLVTSTSFQAACWPRNELSEFNHCSNIRGEDGDIAIFISALR